MVKKETTKNRKFSTRKTKPIRVAESLHQELKILAAANNKTMQELAEYALREYLPGMGDIK